MIDVGSRINDIRVASGVSIYRLSKLTDIDQTALAHNISGKHEITLRNLDRVCVALGVSMSDFFDEHLTAYTCVQNGRDVPFPDVLAAPDGS